MNYILSQSSNNVGDAENTYNGVYLKSEVENKYSQYEFKNNTGPKYPLTDSFIAAIVGKPGSGKSSLIYELLHHENIWLHKFDNCFFMTPSGISKIIPTESNFCTRFDLGWLLRKIHDYDKSIDEKKEIDEKIICKNNLETNGENTPQTKIAILQNSLINPYLFQNMNKEVLKPKTDIELLQDKIINQNKKDKRVLIVFDDMISDINKAQNDVNLRSLFFNRRHIAKNFEISILITSQKYMTIPTVIRSCFSFVILFQPLRKDWITVQEELVYKKNPTTMQRCEIHMRNKFKFITIIFDPDYSIWLNLSTRVE